MIGLFGILIAIFLAVRFETDESHFEINRQAEHSVKYKRLARFLEIYPGLRVLSHILALIFAVFLTGVAVAHWGVVGGGMVAFGALLLAYLISRTVKNVFIRLISDHLAWLNKYFGWVSILSRIAIVGDDPMITSEQELLHVIEKGDFLGDNDKQLIKNTLSFRDKTVKDVLTPRDQIAFVHTRDRLTPKLLNELYESGHKIFPVTGGNLDNVAGLLHLDDVLPVEQEEKSLVGTMRNVPPLIDIAAPLEAALKQMAEYHNSVLLVEKDGKVVGLVTLTDITHALFNSYVA